MEQLDFIKHLSFANKAWVIVLPCILMALDFLTGFINAWIKRQIKSYIMRSGLGKKFGELVAIFMAIIFSCAFGFPHYVMDGVSIYIILMETISIFENLEKLGVPIPKFVSKALNQAEDKIQNESKKDGDTK